jgi:hypothetical protein
MFWVEFVPTIPAFEQASPLHDLDRAAILIGLMECYISVLEYS